MGKNGIPKFLRSSSQGNHRNRDEWKAEILRHIVSAFELNDHERIAGITPKQVSQFFETSPQKASLIIHAAGMVKSEVSDNICRSHYIIEEVQDTRDPPEDIVRLDSVLEELVKGRGETTVNVRSLARRLGLPSGRGAHTHYRKIARHIKEKWNGDFAGCARAIGNKEEPKRPQLSGRALFVIQEVRT